MISKIFNSRIFLIFLSIFLAGILYINATSVATENAGNNNTGGQIYSTILKNIPVTVNYNNNKYFVTGYISSANVYLTSYNQIQLMQEESSDLRSFTLSADLTGLAVGKHEVSIKVLNLPETVNAEVSPSSMSVTIEKRVTKSMLITPVIDSKLLPSGYSIDGITLDPSEITVTAGEYSIKNIAKVEAIIPSNVSLDNDFTGMVNLVAVNSEGNVVPALFSKSSVKMTIKVDKPTDNSSSSSSSS